MSTHPRNTHPTLFEWTEAERLKAIEKAEKQVQVKQYPYIVASITPYVRTWEYEYFDFDYDKQKEIRFLIGYDTAKYEMMNRKMKIQERIFKDDLLKITYR